MDTDEARQRRQPRSPHRLMLPSPRAAAIAIAVTIVEVQASLRPPRQPERLSHYSLWPFWDYLADHAAASPPAPAVHLRMVTLHQRAPGLADAAVAVGYAGRVEPLALLIDGARGRWELVALECSTAFAADPPAPLLAPPTGRWISASSLYDSNHTAIGDPSTGPVTRHRRPGLHQAPEIKPPKGMEIDL